MRNVIVLNENERLKKKAREGTNNIVTQLLKNSEIQRLLTMQSLKSGLFLACFLVGLMDLTNVLKVVFNLDWKLDLVKGVILLIVGVIYLLKKTR